MDTIIVLLNLGPGLKGAVYENEKIVQIWTKSKHFDTSKLPYWM